MPEQLDAPIGLNVVVLSDTAYLSWDGVPGASSYSVRYKLSTDSSWTTTTSSLPAVRLPSLTPSSTYDWSVQAIGDGIETTTSEWSTAGTFNIAGSFTLAVSPVNRTFALGNAVVVQGNIQAPDGSAREAYNTRCCVQLLGLELTSGVLNKKMKYVFDSGELASGKYTAIVYVLDKEQVFCSASANATWTISKS